ncbi:hypothetical protein MPER_01428, partial [Moniliophthora perniciosa FA553]
MFVGRKDSGTNSNSPSEDAGVLTMTRKIEPKEEQEPPMMLMDDNMKTVVDLQSKLGKTQNELYTARLKLQTSQRDHADTTAKLRKRISTLTRDLADARKGKEDA